MFGVSLDTYGVLTESLHSNYNDSDMHLFAGSNAIRTDVRFTGKRHGRKDYMGNVLYLLFHVSLHSYGL